MKPASVDLGPLARNIVAFCDKADMTLPGRTPGFLRTNAETAAALDALRPDAAQIFLTASEYVMNASDSLRNVRTEWSAEGPFAFKLKGRTIQAGTGRTGTVTKGASQKWTKPQARALRAIERALALFVSPLLFGNDNLQPGEGLTAENVADLRKAAQDLAPKSLRTDGSSRRTRGKVPDVRFGRPEDGDVIIQGKSIPLSPQQLIALRAMNESFPRTVKGPTLCNKHGVHYPNRVLNGLIQKHVVLKRLIRMSGSQHNGYGLTAKIKAQ